MFKKINGEYFYIPSGILLIFIGYHEDNGIWTPIFSIWGVLCILVGIAHLIEIPGSRKKAAEHDYRMSFVKKAQAVDGGRYEYKRRIEIMTNEYIIDYKDKSYLTIWWGSDDGGIIYTAEFQCYFMEEGVYEAMVIDSYQSIGDTKLSYQLTSKELVETTEIVEEWFYNNSECI